MRKIEEISDLNRLKAHYLIKDYLFDFLNHFMDCYDCESIKEFGALYVFSTPADAEQYRQLGLSEPFKEALAEFADHIIIKSDKENVEFYQVCFVIDNDYSVAVIVPPDIFLQSFAPAESYQMSEMEVNINVRK